MDIQIELRTGSPYKSITLSDTCLRSLKRTDTAIAHLSDEDKDLVMQAKDERFKKVVAKPLDAESGGTDRDVDAGG